MHMHMIRQTWPHVAFTWELSRAPYSIEGEGVATRAPLSLTKFYIDTSMTFERKFRTASIEKLKERAARNAQMTREELAAAHPIDRFALWLCVEDGKAAESRLMIGQGNVLNIAPTLFGHVERHVIASVLKMFAENKHVVPEYIA